MNKNSFFFLSISLLSTSLIAAPQGLIDANLDEAHWQNARKITELKVVLPKTLATPEDATEVLIHHDENGIYFAFVNHYETQRDTSQTTLQDQDIRADLNEVIIDFDGNGRAAYGFRVGRNGASQDMLWQYPQQSNTDWDGDWIYAVKQTELAWTSEIFIPWSVALISQTVIDEDEGEEALKKINVYLSRWDQYKQQQYAFPSIDSDRAQFLSQLYALVIEQPDVSSLDFFPYATVAYDNIAKQREIKSGVDIFWKFSGNQQLNLSINPDFGQVENDELVVNFSAIETFFSEKRPFFRENHDLFDLSGPENLRLVHTPRIGGKPDQPLSEEDDKTEISDLAAAEIDVATRYTFKGENLDVGLLYANEKNAGLALGRDYSALRLRYSENAYKLGFLHTLTDRPTLNRSANISVIDAQIEAAEEWQVSGQIIHTDIEENGVNTRADSYWLASTYNGSEQASHELTILNYDANMDVSDFGFVERTNRQQVEYEFSYEWPDAKFIQGVRDIEIALETEHRRNQHKQKLTSQYGAKFSTVLDNNWGIGAEAEYVTKGFDDLLTRGNNIVALPNGYELAANIASAEDNLIQWPFEFIAGETGLSADYFEVGSEFSFQLSKYMRLEIIASRELENSWLAWEEGNTINEYRRSESSVSTSLFATFDERHEIRFKLENVALSAAGKRQYNAKLDGELAFGKDKVDDFSLSELALQLRYRYRMSNTSDIYLVYSRGGESEIDGLKGSTKNLLSNSFDLLDQENFLLKIALHW